MILGRTRWTASSDKLVGGENDSHRLCIVEHTRWLLCLCTRLSHRDVDEFGAGVVAIAIEAPCTAKGSLKKKWGIRPREKLSGRAVILSYTQHAGRTIGSTTRLHCCWQRWRRIGGQKYGFERRGVVIHQRLYKCEHPNEGCYSYLKSRAPKYAYHGEGWCRHGLLTFVLEYVHTQLMEGRSLWRWSSKCGKHEDAQQCLSITPLWYRSFDLFWAFGQTERHYQYKQISRGFEWNPIPVGTFRDSNNNCVCWAIAHRNRNRSRVTSPTLEKQSHSQSCFVPKYQQFDRVVYFTVRGIGNKNEPREEGNVDKKPWS